MEPSVLRLVKLAASFVLALPIGWDREHEERTAGIRTFPLVAMGSCGLMLVILAAPDQDSGATSRVLQGLITGIGFVGGGAILRRKEGDVHGIATAASIWNMAIVGAAVGLGLYEIAVAMTAIDFVILRFLFPLKKRLDDQR